VRKLGLGAVTLFFLAVTPALPVFAQGSTPAPVAPMQSNTPAAVQAAPSDKPSSASADKRTKRAGKQTVNADAVAAPGVSAPDRPDYDAIYKLKDEGFSRSQIMEIESYLTDVYGPRLTNSPNIKEARDWTIKKLNEWQLANVKAEAWEPFGRGWSNEKFFAEMVGPRPFILIGYPKTWTPGTNGPVTADVVYAPITKEEDMAKWKGQLKGKLVITQVPDPLLPHFEADAKRYTDAELADLANFQITGGDDKARAERIAQFRAQRDLQAKIMKFFIDEGVVAWLEDQRGDDGTVFAQQGGSRDPKDPPALPRVALAAEHYGRIYRLLEKKVPVSVTLDIQNKFYDDDLKSFNITAEIPGTDKADEVVMLGGHFDSWQAGTGATDNGAGSAVMLEAIRILKASGLKMRRTVRIGLWTGEEEGLLGSRAYVKEHFGDPETMKLTPEHAKLDAYYNIDNGTGKIRGVYLQGNEAVAPIFTAWMEPFHNLGMSTLSIRNTGGTDHLSFNSVGLPGFQFIQDPMDYDSRTHHSNMDLYERVQEADMKQMAVIVASFVYMTANRPDMIPRKPLPPPTPQTQF
jgi:carboxypeptidase Q